MAYKRVKNGILNAAPDLSPQDGLVAWSDQEEIKKITAYNIRGCPQHWPRLKCEDIKFLAGRINR